MHNMIAFSFVTESVTKVCHTYGNCQPDLTENHNYNHIKNKLAEKS